MAEFALSEREEDYGWEVVTLCDDNTIQVENGRNGAVVIVHDDGLIRFCASPYEPYLHLTRAKATDIADLLREAVIISDRLHSTD